MRKVPSPIFHKMFGYFWPLSGESPCLGIAMGRRALWAVETSGTSGKPGGVEWAERIPLTTPLFEGEPEPDTLPQLTQALALLFEKARGTYTNFQVALPDPLVRFEVFELEKVPETRKAMEEFLAWRFNQGREEASPAMAFTHQLLGIEGEKYLVLGMGMEQRWLKTLQQAFETSGIPVSVTDMALAHRFNLFHEVFWEKGGSGALVSIEPEYWSLALWDVQTRPRFARSKWWNKEALELGDMALAEMVLEVERTIRSYVYSGKDRSVEKVFVLAPERWLEPALEALKGPTGGNCEGLSLDRGPLSMAPKAFPDAVPSALAAAAKR